MRIGGIQKTTLIDFPGKIACDVFLHGCNFKCGYCHNPELVIGSSGREYSQQEILGFLRDRKKYLNGVCITGGEPLLGIDFEFLGKIKSLDYSIKIDTNGSFPKKLKELIKKNLVDYIAMDIKGSKEKYTEIIKRNIDLDKIEESIKIISNFSDYEFRTTILKKYHDAEDVRKIGEWLKTVCGKKPKKYCLQGFKNNGKFIDESFKEEKDVEEDYLLQLKGVSQQYFGKVEIRV